MCSNTNTKNNLAGNTYVNYHSKNSSNIMEFLLEVKMQKIPVNVQSRKYYSTVTKIN